MKTLRIVLLAVMFTGCGGQSRQILPRENASCKGVRDFWDSESWGATISTHSSGAIVQSPEDLTVAYYGKDSNEPLQKSRFEDLQAEALQDAGCCSCTTYSEAKDWTNYIQLECMWEYLENETVQKIGFCFTFGYGNPADWGNDNFSHCADIAEPERIKEILKLLEKGIRSESNMFVHGDTGCAFDGWIRIVTDKHKFTTPFWYNCIVKGAFCGVGWTSRELTGKMKQWYPDKNSFMYKCLHRSDEK